jgi:parallel beta-helix repeat protein
MLLTVVFSGCNEETKKTPTPVKSSTIYVGKFGEYDYSDIQSAINAADTGNTIYVYSGFYDENIVINKTINLVGEDKDTTTIFSNTYEDDVIFISADNVKISGFTIWGTTAYIANQTFGSRGIESYNNNITLSDNIVQFNVDAILLQLSSNHIISNNIIENNYGYGIFFSYSSNNIISGNTIRNNDYGISLGGSTSSTIISGNTISNNSNDGIWLRSSNNDNISGNTIINNEWSGIHFDYANNNIISNNTIKNNYYSGINLESSNSSIISGNTINNQFFGIDIDYSSNNVISSNSIQNNKYHGIYFYFSDDNIIFNNNLISNTENANDTGHNAWYNTTFKEGNYWSDYQGTDANDDGIGDTPYNIPRGENQDMYPLMKPFDI